MARVKIVSDPYENKITYSFDIIVLRDRVAVEIRRKVIAAIKPLAEYTFTGKPVVNGRGFEALVDSAESFAEFIDEYETTMASEDSCAGAKTTSELSSFCWDLHTT